MQAVILAGGRGERLKPLTDNVPKPLIKIDGKPLLERQILLLRRHNIKDIWILSGYLGEQIEKYFGDGKKRGVKIHHLIEKEPLGTAGAIKILESKIKNDFLVLSGDVVCNFDVKSFINFHKKRKDPVATIIVHPNDHPQDSDLVEVGKNDQIINFLIRPHSKELISHNLSIASVFILSPKIFKYIRGDTKSDLEKDILPGILKSGGKLYAYKTAEYIKDVGIPKRLKQVRQDLASKKVARFNRNYKRRAIFIDRDGVINESIDNLLNLDEFRLFPFAARAIKKINDSGYLAIVVTNQPMIAKGLMTFEDLDLIHKKLETDLGKFGAKIDGIYFCPHHPEIGFEGEVLSLKIKCNCRKPKIGLVKRAARDFNIDLTGSYFIGDSTVDARTAENAGLKFVGVKTGYNLQDQKYPVAVSSIIRSKNLLGAVNLVLKD